MYRKHCRAELYPPLPGLRPQTPFLEPKGNSNKIFRFAHRCHQLFLVKNTCVQQNCEPRHWNQIQVWVRQLSTEKKNCTLSHAMGCLFFSFHGILVSLVCRSCAQAYFPIDFSDIRAVTDYGRGGNAEVSTNLCRQSPPSISFHGRFKQVSL